MCPQGCRRKIFCALIGAAIAFFTAKVAIAQEGKSAGVESAVNAQELVRTLGELAAQVKTLNARLDTVSAEQAKSVEEANRLRHELELANARLAALESPGRAAGASAEVTGTVAPDPIASKALEEKRSASVPPTLEERLGRLEENQDFLDAKIGDQYQTKVESGSKYRVRFSGIFLLNLYGNRGAVDNQDFPELATEHEGAESYGAFGGSLRQSQIGMEGFGPNILGAHTSARIRFDFAGNATGTSNGALMGTMRLRTGTFRMDWKNTSLVAGQDALFFAPLTPTSLASLATPALSYAGNLWGWTPQVRVEHQFTVTENGSLKVAGGVMAPLSGDVPEISQDREATWGEQAGIPALAAHVAWEQKTANGTWSIGTGGYYGRQSWGFGRTVDSWTSTVDLLVPVGKYLEFSGEFYRGRAVGGLGGGVGQSVLLTGPLGDPASSVHGLNSEGGWAQLKVKPRANFQLNAAFGQDNPFASQLRFFPVVPSEYEEALTRTRSWFVNFLYEPRSNVVVSLEYKRLSTFDVGPDGYAANHLNLSLGYIF